MAKTNSTDIERLDKAIERKRRKIEKSKSYFERVQAERKAAWTQLEVELILMICQRDQMAMSDAPEIGEAE